LALTDRSELLNSFGFFRFDPSAPPMALIKLNLSRSMRVPGKSRVARPLDWGESTFGAMDTSGMKCQRIAQNPAEQPNEMSKQ
jgi:hypothetical protein